MPISNVYKVEWRFTGNKRVNNPNKPVEQVDVALPRATNFSLVLAANENAVRGVLQTGQATPGNHALEILGATLVVAGVLN